MTVSETDQVVVEREDDTILEVRDVSVQFNMDRGTSRVLSEVNLDIHQQERLGIVGESGSGKSMFASSLLDAVVDPGQVRGDIRYYPPDRSETVEVLELSERELKNLRWEEISMVFQGAMSSFNPVRRIRTHFRETIKEHDYDMEERMEHARDLLSDLYLDPDRVFDSYPHELSGGMKQRAMLALSLVLEPNVLVMDEPTAALDLLMQRSILSLIEDLQRGYDLTIIFITHDLPLVADLADRLAVLYAFEFVEVGPTVDIVASPAHPYTRSLLNAVPSLQTPLSEMRPIEGSSPDPVNIPSGCSYHPRCELADDQCRNVDPELEEIEANHTAACHHWEDAEEAIPVAYKQEGVERTDAYEGTQSEDAVVSLSDLSVHFESSSSGIFGLFDDPNIVQAVNDVDLDIYENDVVALVGESGCGKTTLGKTAIGLQRPTDGSVEYRGQDIWKAHDNEDDVEIPFSEIRQSLQIIHQDPGSSLNPYRTVKQTLAEPLKQWYDELNEDDREARILGMLEEVGMTPPNDYAERYPHQLSGGEKQRAALIRALLMNPDLILADEAVSALDVSLRVGMMDLLLELQEEFDTSYLFVSHNLSNARYLTGKVEGRIAVMYLGDIVEIGPTEQVIRDPQHPYTQVLKWAAADLTLDQQVEEPPIRTIDIPDPENPPSGCKFHTRCPEAREVCRTDEPTLRCGEEAVDRHAACFREYPTDHEYWDSEPIASDDD
jgi:peptide/nickel transport system ATP-binding protein